MLVVESIVKQKSKFPMETFPSLANELDNTLLDQLFVAAMYMLYPFGQKGTGRSPKKKCKVKNNEKYCEIKNDFFLTFYFTILSIILDFAPFFRDLPVPF